MASEGGSASQLAAQVQAGSGPGGLPPRLEALASNPYLWSGLAGLFLGLALGRAFRWILSLIKGDSRRAAGRSSLSFICFSLAVLSVAGLLVRCPPAELDFRPLLLWGSVTASLGLLAGLFPLAAGLPLALLVGFGVQALGGELSAYVPLAGPGPIASLTCFSSPAPGEGSAPGSGTALFSGQLELEQRDSVPVMQRVEAELSAAALVVERLDLSGPLGLIAGERLYRVVGLAESSEGPRVLRFETSARLLDLLAPLSAEGEAEARGFLIRRQRAASPALPLRPLETIHYSFGPELSLEALEAGLPPP